MPKPVFKNDAKPSKKEHETDGYIGGTFYSKEEVDAAVKKSGFKNPIIESIKGKIHPKVWDDIKKKALGSK